MNQIYEQQYKIRYFETNKFMEATPISILTLLEETAASHILESGYNIYDLLKKNIGWVLISGFIEMKYYPKYKEDIIIRTWISSYSKITAIRENMILNKKGDTIGLAKGKWLFFDIKNRKPLKIFDDIIKNCPVIPQVCCKKNIPLKIPALKSHEFQKSFSVTNYDVDTNKHLNNIRYLQWLLETIPNTIQENYFLKSIAGCFVDEAQYGDKLKSLTCQGLRENSYIHTIKKYSQNTICLTATSEWEKRKVDF